MRRKAGLDLQLFAAELHDRIYLRKVCEQIEGTRHNYMRATPTFFVNGLVQDIWFGMKALHDAVSDAVQRMA